MGCVSVLGPANVVTLTGISSAVFGIVTTYRKLNALALFVIDVVRFTRAFVTPSVAVYVNEGTGVPLYNTFPVTDEDCVTPCVKFAKRFALVATVRSVDAGMAVLAPPCTGTV
jgi:hypothetical protein